MRPLGRLRVLVLFLLFCGGSLFSQLLPVKPRITTAVKESQVTTLRSNTHPLARAEFEVGPAQPNLPLQRMLLVLKRSPEQEHALSGLLDQLQDKSSSHYHEWLTPEQFGELFGPADSDIEAVTAWLQSHGFQIGEVAKGRTVIEFSGTAAQVQSTFHTSIHKYVVDGEEHWANSSDPQIPSALTPVVAGVATLHNFLKKPLLRISPDRIPFTRSPFSIPASTFTGNQHAISPGDYATIYNIKPLYQAGIDGTGSSVAVVGRTEIDLSDVYDFGGIFGLSLNFSLVFNGPNPGNLQGGEEAEAILDSTWSSSIAPGAAVQLVISASTDTTDGVDLSELYIIDHNLADVMTESFGSCEAFYTQADADFTSNMAKQAAAQGITYLVSTGDSGASGCDRPSASSATGPLSVNILASTPYTVAVGGTMFNEHGQDATYWNPAPGSFAATAKSYIPENVWNESCSTAQCGAQKANLWAGGGGVSKFFGKPSWQAGVAGIPNDGKRDLPDVSLTAAGHDPYLICYERSCVSANEMFGISGTSASTPSFAGIMALINQKMGGRQGQANYVLYRLAAKETFSQCNGSKTTGAPAATCVFNDTTVGNIAVPGQSGFGTSAGKYQATTAYDLATGLGSVNVNNLAKQWGSVTFNSTTTTLALSPLTIAHGSPVTVNISVAPNGGSGTPTGTAVLQGSAATAEIDQFALNAGSASTSTNLLPGGTYDVVAHYSGDGTFGSSDSAAVNVTVTPESSLTTLRVLTADAKGNPVPFTSGPYGSFIYPRADVTGQSGHGIPTGNLFLSEGFLSLDTFTLNSEGNAAPPNGYTSFAPGSHSLLATYTGDSSFNSSSGTANFDITVAATSNALTVDKTSIGNGSTVSLSARIDTNSLASNAPSGSITFLSGATSIGSASLFPGIDPKTGRVFSATTTFQTSTLPVGEDVITASYEGDMYYGPSTSQAVTVSVQHEFAVAVDKKVITLKQGQSGSVSLTVTGEPGYDGTINFEASSCTGLPNASSCSFSPASITGSGKTTVSISTTARSSLAPATRSIFYAFWSTSGGLFVGIFMFPVAGKRWRRIAFLMVVLTFVVVGTSCGGGGGGSHNPGTTAGNYTISITATNGKLSHVASFNLTVQ